METFAEVAEYVGLYETTQGNINTAGLVWEHIVDDGIDLSQDVYFLWVEEIQDLFDIQPAFNPFHILDLTEEFTINDVVGNIPLEVYSANLNVIHRREAAPVKVWWFGVNVIHGPDTYFEEVYSNAHMRTTYTQAVPYHFRHIYESINFEFHNIQPHPGIIKLLSLESRDRVNFRHSVEQQYYFNNYSKDQLFTYDDVVWGWGHDVKDAFDFMDYAVRQLGFTISDHYFPEDSSEASIKGGLPINEKLFAWDKSVIANMWPQAIDEDIDWSDHASAPIIAKLMESIGISAEVSKTNWINQLSVEDKIKAQEKVLILKQIISKIIQGFALYEHSESKLIKTYLENIFDGVSLTTETVAGMFFLDIIEETLSGSDTSRSKSSVKLDVSDEANFTEGAN